MKRIIPAAVLAVSLFTLTQPCAAFVYTLPEDAMLGYSYDTSRKEWVMPTPPGGFIITPYPAIRPEHVSEIVAESVQRDIKRFLVKGERGPADLLMEFKSKIIQGRYVLTLQAPFRGTVSVNVLDKLELAARQERQSQLKHTSETIDKVLRSGAESGVFVSANR